MKESSILKDLNPSQIEAVTTTEGYVRVIAGAGSGKTRALTARYAYIIEELGISPANILCLTFTNKAAREMKKRVRLLTGDHVDTSFVATIHSFCARILREDIGKLYYPESFIVLDNADQKKILEEVYDEMGLKMDTMSFETMIDKIKYYKNLLTYLDFVAVPEMNMDDKKPENLEEKIIIRYIMKQKKYFGLDYFDLINFVIYLFNKYADIEAKWAERMHYVMVDEFQDITSKEFKLIRRITRIHKNWFVVGDPDQNIYEWRGSKMEVLVDFDKKMEPCTTIFMSENYRSTPQIIGAANSLIDKNNMRIEKALVSNRSNGENVVHFHGKSEQSEISFVISEIRGHIENGGKYADIAILYRSSHVSRFIEHGLLSANIPYTVWGGTGFYERSEIKDVLSYLRIVEHSDDLSFLRVVNTPRRKMGKKKLAAVRAFAEKDGTSLYEALRNNITSPVFSGSGAAKFVSAVEELKAQKDNLQVSELLQKLLISVEYELYLRESGDMDRLDNVSELLRSIVMAEMEYGEEYPLDAYLGEVSLLRDNAEDEDKDFVRIMTVHTSKGLEFPVVFICGMSDGVFPSKRSMDERLESALEEERRLAFVAMTRAKNKLFLTESEGFGVKGFNKVPSRFIFDIADDKIERVGEISEQLREIYHYRINDKRISGKAEFEKGSHVKHRVFGEGVIEDTDEDTKSYIVRFAHGTKPISFAYKGLFLLE